MLNKSYIHNGAHIAMLTGVNRYERLDNASHRAMLAVPHIQLLAPVLEVINYGLLHCQLGLGYGNTKKAIIKALPVKAAAILNVHDVKSSKQMANFMLDLLAAIQCKLDFQHTASDLGYDHYVMFRNVGRMAKNILDNRPSIVARYYHLLDHKYYILWADKIPVVIYGIGCHAFTDKTLDNYYLVNIELLAEYNAIINGVNTYA